MATKSKNRIGLIIWALLCSYGISGLLSVLAYSSQYAYRDYFQSPGFNAYLDQYVYYLNALELNDLTMEEAKGNITVTEDDITEHRYRYGSLTHQVENIKSQYAENIQDAQDAGNQEVANILIAERDAKIEDITQNFKSDEHIRPKVIKEKEQQLEEVFSQKKSLQADYLKYKKTFHYYMKNIETGEIQTDLQLAGGDEAAKEYFATGDVLFARDYSISPDYSGMYGDESLREFSGKDSFEGQIAMPASLPSSNFIMAEYADFGKNQLFLLVYSLSGILVLLFCFILAKKRDILPAGADIWNSYYNRMPFDARVILFLAAAAGALITELIAVESFLQAMNLNTFTLEFLGSLLLGSVFLALVFIQGKFLGASLSEPDRMNKEWDKTIFKTGLKGVKELTGQVFGIVKDAFLIRGFGTQVFIVMALVFGLGFAAIFIEDPGTLLVYVIVLAACGIPLAGVILKRVGYFNKIALVSAELAEGKRGEDLPIEGKSVLAKLAGNLNLLKQSVRVSQNAQAKSERLKTELITNVSHDLRTPLTSIITYTELLKNGDASAEEQSSYIEIIDRKSKRLKVLIEDLFEVSKMASGNIELQKERVDLVQLLHQALAEHDNTIRETTLQLRVTTPDPPVWAMVDGQKLWRVFDNLIGNILKYSMDHSRVYITLAVSDGWAAFTFKNVSKYELSENADELYERFKRGDASRNTDGSGLGLAIAKSIVDLHDGKMDIETDGDLFKAVISLEIEEK